MRGNEIMSFLNAMQRVKNFERNGWKISYQTSDTEYILKITATNNEGTEIVLYEALGEFSKNNGNNEKA
jgi:hypothetical protein